MTIFGLALIAAWWVVLLFVWSLCRVAALADRRTEHELQAAPHGTDAAPNAAAGDPAPPSSAPRIVPITRKRQGR